MFQECAGCHHVYNVKSYKPNQRLRCSCEQVLVVPKNGIMSHVVKMLHCSNCGGQLSRGASKCPYCDSLVDLTSARLNAYCPSCLSMSPDDAKFCCGCGEPLLELLARPVKASQNCPRCRITMRRRSLAGQQPLECPMCCGLFVEGDDFVELLNDPSNRANGDLFVRPGKHLPLDWL